METAPAPRSAILIAVSFESQRGTGHLLRSADLARHLNDAGRKVFILLGTDRSTEDACALAGNSLKDMLITEEEARRHRWTLIITDRFCTPEKEFFWLRSLAPIIGLDEGGTCRRHYDFLVDLLPALSSRIPANIYRPSLLSLPCTRKTPLFPPIPAAGARILVVFGSEDTAHLARDAARALLKLPQSSVTVITGSQNFAAQEEDRLSMVSAIPNLREMFARFDLVITHFGLSAFEALHAGTAVMLIAPTRYHLRLGKKAGFFQAGLRRRGIRRLFQLCAASDTEKLRETLRNTSCDAAHHHAIAAVPHQNLAQFIASLSPAASVVCPLCGAALEPVCVRAEERSYRRCVRCKSYLMARTVPPDTRYTSRYFFEDYRQQYGKTYIEDFPHLTELANRRLRHIKAGGRLLDVGCAYGAFLAAAREAGFEAQGLDPSEDAVRFVGEQLGMKAVQGYFPEGLPAEETAEGFEVITLWYVIEHFALPNEALRKAAALLKTGGTLAFSTPSADGISALCSRRRFLEASPADHWTIWHPRTVRFILRRYGFTVTRIVITGHHPERFPLIGRYLPRLPLLRGLCTMISKLCGWGDTFEVYARKTGADNNSR